MSPQHYSSAFLIHARAHQLDIIVGCQARNLRGLLRRMELRRQNLRSLPGPRFVAVLDAIESDAAFGEMLRDALNGSSSLVGQASLWVFGLRFGGSGLHEIDCLGFLLHGEF